MKLATTFTTLFLLILGPLMFMNTFYFELGDPKFGTSGWTLYWPLWAVFYTPAVLICSVFSYKLRLQPADQMWFLGIMLVTLLAIVETTFILDLKWPWLMLETVVIFVVCAVLSKNLLGVRPPHNKRMQSDASKPRR